MATSANSAPGDHAEGVGIPGHSADSDPALPPPIPLSLRRPTVFAIAAAVLALVATGPIDKLLLGVFICIGLALGWANAQLARYAVIRITDSETPSKQKMALSSASRLLIISAIAIVIAFLLKPNGIGIFFGLAVFQVILVLHTTVPAVKGLRQQS